VLGRFRFFDYNPQWMRAAPAVVTDFDVGYDIPGTAMWAFSIFHGCSPLPSSKEL
jgi:hypothetical protein